MLVSAKSQVLHVIRAQMYGPSKSRPYTEGKNIHTDRRSACFFLTAPNFAYHKPISVLRREAKVGALHVLTPPSPLIASAGGLLLVKASFLLRGIHPDLVAICWNIHTPNKSTLRHPCRYVRIHCRMTVGSGHAMSYILDYTTWITIEAWTFSDRPNTNLKH